MFYNFGQVLQLFKKNFENYFICFIMFFNNFWFFGNSLSLFAIVDHFDVVCCCWQNQTKRWQFFVKYFSYNFTIATSGQQSKFICIVFIFNFGTKIINTSKLFKWWLVGSWMATIGVGALCLRFSFLYFQMKSKQNGTWQSLFLIYLKKKWNFWNPVAKFDK